MAHHATLLDYHFEQLEQRINSGYYAVGARLPGESELASELGISRPLVRELLARLRERGYVETFNGRGSFIRSATSESMLQAMLREIELKVGREYSVDDLYAVRSTIEVETARIAAIVADSDDLNAIQLHMDEMRAAEGDPEKYTLADIRFHLAVATATKNQLFPALLTPIIEVIVRGMYDSVSIFSDGMRGGIEGHEKLVAALLEKNSTAAADAMREHMNYSRSTFPESVFEEKSPRE